MDSESLSFQGAKPVKVSVGDANRDGIPDLVAVFPMRGLRLHPNAQAATLTGWLKNSQAFIGTDSVSVVPSLAFAEPVCR